MGILSVDDLDFISTVAKSNATYDDEYSSWVDYDDDDGGSYYYYYY